MPIICDSWINTDARNVGMSISHRMVTTRRVSRRTPRLKTCLIPGSVRGAVWVRNISWRCRDRDWIIFLRISAMPNFQIIMDLKIYHAVCSAFSLTHIYYTGNVWSMDQYKCTKCGYIYIPENGDPRQGISANTTFEDLPDTWVCPRCRVGKRFFVKIPWLKERIYSAPFFATIFPRALREFFL